MALGTVVLRPCAIIILLIAVALMLGGGYLVILGGTIYYLFVGMAFAVSGILLWRRRGEGARMYFVTVLLTLTWAVWEVGFDAWALLPRLLLPTVLSLVLWLPATRSALLSHSAPWGVPKSLLAVVIALIVGISTRAVVPPLTPPDPLYQAGTIKLDDGNVIPAVAAVGDWSHYGNDAAGTRFSTAGQITPENVARLQIAWRYRIDSSRGFEATPLMVGRALYLCTNENSVVALDAETGRELWGFRPATRAKPHGCRGVAYYRVPGASGLCAERIITASIATSLFALDAHTGQRCADFGIDGEVSLLPGLGEVPETYYYVTSAPTIANGKIVVGGWVFDNQHWPEEPSGVIRAFDASTGKSAWAWDLGRPDHNGEPPEGETYTRSTPNSWAPMSVDEEAGLIYAPLGNATGSDFFGGYRRAFDDQYSSSIVALDTATGKLRWSFQTVHHDLWDYDVASQPTLVDFRMGERTVRALVQPTKRGELFVLDRATGEPLYPVEELPAPQRGKVTEEYLSPTQPFSVGLPSFRGADLVERDMWGLTPVDQLWCRIKFREARYEGTLTPPGLTPSIQMPSVLGGMVWGGVAVDTARDIVIVNSNNLPNYVRLVMRSEANQLGLRQHTSRTDGHAGRATFATFWRWVQNGTPYGVLQPPFWSPLEVPCTRPPYGRLSAVDLKTGKLIWTQPLGTARELGPMGMALGLPFTIGTPSSGGAVATQSGVVFIGAALDRYLRAYNTVTGRLLWEAKLPAGGNATPMTYMSPQSSRQFVVIASGANAVFTPKNGSYIVAYALPRQ
ncbi:membrane-bound PQQ-dependent dehydrogenase, glucose/quinate/shikimate family [Steroidobacter flavus]|uniref:Membrane-bound PQQ-dependent dehydrogenase, glucose/quinate/shikimate family n=1 Tax=Steroidobacter flavus TaxID=1842136 RepID=A0ABV8SZA2_9GAMM